MHHHLKLAAGRTPSDFPTPDGSRRSAKSRSAPKRSIFGVVVRTLLAPMFVFAFLHTAIAEDPKVFLDAYCVRCHGSKQPKGDRSFDKLVFSDASEDTQLDLQDILDQLTLGEMPPKKAKQPTVEERQATIDWLTKRIDLVNQKRTSTNAQAVLRRLNRREYLNTIRDLFGMNMSMFDPTTKFPRDQTVEHLDNIGDTLVTSGFLLQQYLYAADQIVEKAFEKHNSEERTWNFKDRFKQQPEVDTAHGAAFQNRYMCLYECPNSERPEGAFGPLLDFREGVPADGLYEVRVYVEAKNREHPYDPRIMGTDPAEPLRIGIVPGNITFGAMHLTQPFQPVLAERALPDGGPEWQTFTIWLDKGFSPRFIFPNGMIDIRSSYAKLVNQYPVLLPENAPKKGDIVGNRIALFSNGKVPHLRIHEVAIRGPLAETPKVFRDSFYDGEKLDSSNSRQKISEFASRAYRRSVDDDEIDRLMSIVEQRRAEGKTDEEALQDGVRAILCSTSFLYLQQDTQGPDSPKLQAHALANRLSYFLWSSMPDQELRSLADSGAILQTETLRQQTQRMLADPKSDSFVERFLDSWLNLRSLGDMPPDRETFERYYSNDLQEAMRRETFLFTRDLIDQNESLLKFLTADYSFVNRPLAKLYEVEGQIDVAEGHRFHRVRFDDPNRGGLLGQGSVLTVTANGVETSPVIRGVWLLENILGTPPAPPPDDVPAIDPDVRGAKSMRDLLTKHRDSPACFECHQKIDPLGFALENFDPIGRWRTKYANGSSIDSSGVLPSGETFQDLAGLKEVLVQRQTFFARILTEKLMAYACGRRVEPLDRSSITKIAESLRENDYPMRSLIEQVVLSDLFRWK
ncbi:MAG: DUF1592 domain-containing protein [Pirellulaceae bacterium]|nr:DUF1592 domain-containing protein [Pirellulaceae bacterium]